MKTVEEMLKELEVAVLECIVVPNDMLPESFHDDVRGGRTLARLDEMCEDIADGETAHQKAKAAKARNVEQLRKQVDVLTLSATPIPRSMNLALSGIYSISMLQTPPRFRLPINTRVEHYSNEIVREAIGFEVGRGGQVFFVHNDITNIKKT